MTRNMTEQSSTTLPVSIAMTTIGMMQITDKNTTTSSSSSSHLTGFYFLCAYLVVGVVGTATNALILYALVTSKQHKKHVLIVNQNALDLFTCSMIVVNTFTQASRRPSQRICRLLAVHSAAQRVPHLDRDFRFSYQPGEHYRRTLSDSLR